MDLSFGMDKVIKNLQTGQISSGKQLWYLILAGGSGISLIRALFDSDRVSFSFNNLSELTVVQMMTGVLIILTILVMLFGFLNCYWINKSRDDQDFILRYTVLSANIVWRFLVPPFLLLYFLIFKIFSMSINWPFGSVGHVSVTLLYYGLMNFAFVKVAGKQRG